jgi:hypothetical protein
MRTLPLLLCTLVAGTCVCLSARTQAVTLEPAPIRIEIAAPNYLRIDGRWYVYEKPLAQSAPRITLYPQPSRQGFFAHGYVSARNCRSSSGQSVSTARALEHGESLVGAAAGAVALKDGRVSLAVCPGALVLLIESPTGDLICDQVIAAAYPPGTCETLDELDGIRIFKQGFEGPR